MNNNVFNDFYLVGGTSLALQRGHRISIDIDMFTNASYDKMNRLTGITMNGYTATMTYDEYGRMTAKEAIVSRIGMPNVVNVFTVSTFDSRRFHAVSKITIPSKDVFFPRENQFIEYTSFDKVKTIEQNGNALADLHSYDQHKTLSYLYGYNQQRISMKENIGGTMRTKQYVGNCEYIRENGTEKSLTYLVGPYGVFAVVEKQNDEENIHFILKDHLGSWTTITDAEGNVEQELSYDAWGNLRNPETWCNYTRNEFVEAPMFDRGFTGHEHMTAFDLINMNGRCYDPIMSAFLSVDEYVQDPTCAQSFNKYAYCMNNPLRYVDPSGWQMVGGSTPKHYDWRDKEVPYEPRDFREGSSYMINLRLSGGGGYGGGGVAGTYGYIAAHDPHYINNNFYIDPSPIMRAPTVSEAVRAWWNDPCFETRQALIDAGISELNIGVVKEEGLLYGGARIGFGGKEYYLSLPTLAVGGNDFYVGVIAPYIDNVSSAGSGLSGLHTTNRVAQALGVHFSTLTEGFECAAKSTYGIPLLKPNSGLTSAQKVSVLTKEGAGVLRATKGLGYICAGSSIVVSGYQTVAFYSQGGTGWQVGVKGAFDVGFVVLGALGGPVGLAISIGYMITDWATDGFGVSYEIKP